MITIPNLSEMLTAAELGLAHAQADGNLAALGYRAAESGDLRYRLGDARGAFDSLVLALQHGVGDDSPEDDLSLEVGTALAARRAGLYEEAKGGLERALQHPLAESAAPRAALTAELAFTAGLAGDEARATTLYAQALKLARDGDAVEAMVHALRLRGEGALLAGQPREAGELFQRALELGQDWSAEVGAGEEAVEGVAQVGPSELFGVLIGLHASGVASDEVLLGALALVPEALREAEPWWWLARLAPGVVRLGERGFLGEASLFEPLRIFAAAAVQREDCAQVRAALQAML